MNRKNVETLYPLSPLQQGMLFHALYAPDSGAYVEQAVLRLEGEVNPEAMERAWQLAVNRHGALRTAFVWEGVPQPVQAVLREAKLPFAFHDFRGEGDFDARMAALVEDDRRQAFNLARPPLVRITLVRAAEAEWRLVFSFHHIILDGWSLSIVMSEVLAAYAAFLDGAEPTLPERRPFREYVAWLQRRDAAAAEAFWRGRLGTFSTPTPVPLDRAPARAGEAPEAYGQETVVLPPAEADALTQAARGHRVTLNTLLHGAWAAVLARHAGDGDVVFGTTVSGRPPELPGVEGVVGMFLNTLPVRISVDPAAPIGAWLGAIQARAGEAARYEHAPLAEVQGWSGVGGGAPLFETLFVLENHPVGDPLSGEGDEDPRLPRITDVETAQRTNYAIALTAAPSSAGLHVTATYDAARLDGERARRLLGALRTVLARIASGEARTSGDLDPLSAEERRLVVSGWNATAAEYPRVSISRLFEEQAARTPGAVALRLDSGETVSYAELNARANRVARHLQSLGVGIESRVGVSMERSADLVAALLAIVKAGGAYVPLDPSYPAARLDFMRRDAGVEIVIAADPASVAAWSGEARIVSHGGEGDAIAALPADDLGVEVDAEGLAYVIYTSGSTGQPKGTAVPHRAVVRLVRGQEYASFGADEVFLQLAPVAFDASTLEIWGALLNGGSIAIYPDAVPEPKALGDFVARHGVTTAWLTAGLFHQVVDAGAEGFGGLRQLLAGGDVLSPAHVARAMEILPGVRLIDGYGPTEATTFTCCHTVRPEDADGGAIPIGRPLANARVYVLDAAMRPVPAGAPGELFIAGDGLARGYLGQAEMTAEKFVPDPFSTDGGRLYRTGDRVRWTESAECGSASDRAESERTHALTHSRTAVLDFLGRIDGQVKLRGFRIETGEIEAVLRAHPGVRDAAVALRGEGDLRRLAAYVVGDSVDFDALRAHAAARLPEYMVPSVFVALDALPLTPNGKVDRVALPEPDAATSASTAALATQTEELLAAVWREVLGVESVGPEDDFFTLGGHSLLATRVVSRVRAVFGAELPLRDVFEAPTLRALAARLDAHRGGGAASPPPLVPVPRGKPIPLSFGQERLWLMDRLAPGALPYNIAVPIDLPPETEPEVAARALAELVRRHEALRTVFRDGKRGPVQVILPPSAVDLPAEDLRSGRTEDEEARVEEAVERASGETFDLTAGPLLRARFLRRTASSTLVVVFHHAVFDGWSVPVLEHEVRALVDAFARGLPSPLPELPVQYADWAAWQHRWVDEGGVKPQVDFWRAALVGAPTTLDLPGDRPRPAHATHRGEKHWFHLSPEVVEPARELARKEGATLYMVLLAAFDVLLSRLAGTDDVVVGTQVAGRTVAGVEGLIGFFVNNLALRTDLSGDPDFREVIKRVRKTALDAMAHQDVPFQTLLDELKVERTRSHPPVFQAVFLLQTTGATGTVDRGGVPVLPDHPLPAGTDYELTFDLHEWDGGLLGAALYATDLFDHATAVSFVEQYRRLLEMLVAAPETRVSGPALLGEEEARRVVSEWNATEAEAPRVPLHRLFEARVEHASDAPALRFSRKTTSYGELNARANRLARRLAALGVGAESVVAVSLPRSEEMVVALLAVNKAGGAFLPVDPAYPAERRRWMLDDSGAHVLLTHSSLAADLPSSDARVVEIDRIAAEIEAEDDANLPVEVDAEGAAYLIFTSGSTGRPKGVVVPHRGIGNLARAQGEAFGIGEGSRVLHFASFSFDASVAEVVHTLLNGACLVLSAEEERGGTALLGLMRDEGVTVATLPPSLMAALPDAELPALRTIVSAGEAVSAEVVGRWGAGRRFVNAYGPTETTVCAALAVDPPADARVPIGRPIANARAYVLDARMRPVPAGVPGELYVGGIGVARGYANRPGATAAAFVPDPFSGEPGARIYRTGDRARWLRSGRLEFVGRVDEQVKVRGFRVEPGEVEAGLRAHPSVRDALVVALPAPGGAALAAYVVAAESAGADEAALRAHLAGHLPEYMVPSAFVFLDAFPLTPAGKVDRRALPAPERGVDEDAFVAPRTPTEEILAALWADLLEIERVGADDDFFDLGGHSLLATTLVSRAREALGVEIPVGDVFDFPTLSALAAEVDRARVGAAAPGTIERREREGTDAPVSFSQERLWFVERLEPGSAVYHMPVAYRLRGALDVEALRRAFTELARRHEALRTSLPEVDGLPVQRIAPAGPVDLPLHDLTHLAADDLRAEAERIAGENASRPFDLEAGPLFRAALVRMTADEHYLLVTLHHAVSDGWSMGVLLTEVAALYGAFSRGLPSPLAELPVQYADFAAWQREWLSGDVLDAQLGYWKAKLAGAPPVLGLPTDRPRPAVQTYRAGSVTAYVPREDADAARALGRKEGATMFMVLLAALDLVFSRWSGEDDVVVGTPIAGRTRSETEGLIGMFLNSLALRTDLSGDPAFRELLKRVRETTLDAYAHQDVPFEKVLEAVQPERSLGHSPVFQVMLNLANFGMGEAHIPGLEMEILGSVGEEASKFDLTLYSGEQEDGALALHLVYNADLFDAARMEALLAQLRAVLAQAAADPSRALSAFTLATEEAAAVLPDPSAELDAAWRGSVPSIFAARAAERPDSVAVEDPGERWTYAELDAASSRVARRLMDGGVRPGDTVAILAHRSAPLVRALLGVLKAGAAFVALDPTYPPARLAQYVRIARPRGFLRLAAAGEAPAEVSEALAATSAVEIVLGARDSASSLDAVDGLADVSADAVEVEIGADSLAYLSFTSGTTGTPKAVMGRHGSLTHFTPWVAEEFGLSAGDRFSLLSGLSHDPLHRDVFTPLQLGASIVAPDPEEVGTPGYLARWMASTGVTVAHLTPAMGQVLADVPVLSSEGAVPSLRRAFFVGDVLLRGDVARLTRLAPNVTVVNYYGSTETQRAVSYHVVRPEDAEAAKPIIPLGRGIPGTQLLVRGRSGAVAGVGELGEVWMRSPHVALGYLGDEELTAARFLPNPWTGAEGDFLYRTGDLGRYLPNGEVEPAGRADQQVKVRGFRVELGEVEAALARLPNVREAAALALGEGDDRRIAGYVVPDGAFDADAARAALRAALPDFMVPSVLLVLDRLPLTQNGKLDRRALPRPETARKAAERVEPATPTEKAVAEIWREVLGADAVGAHDDFFALGGHSLRATQVLSRIRARLGAALPVKTFFANPTVAGLAAAVDAIRPPETNQPTEVSTVEAAYPPGVYPLSFAQQRLWVLMQLGAGDAYNMGMALRIRGPLDDWALGHALGEIVRRHETLRTRFEMRDGEPVQVVQPAPPLRLRPERVDAPEGEERDEAFRRLADDELSREFPLDGPFLRVRLLRAADDDHVLLWSTHHVISDGWSQGVFLRELSALYPAFVRGEPSPLPAIAETYGEFALRQRRELGGEMERLAAWWMERLAGAPALLDLPTDRPRPAEPTRRGGLVEFTFDEGTAARIDAFAREHGATPFMVLLSAFQAVLARWSGQDDLVVGTPIANRTTAEVEGLIGFFANTLALRGDLSGDPTFAQLVGRTRETTLGAYEHQDLPFERLVEELRPDRSASHAPVVQVMFVMQNAPRGEGGADLEGITLSGVPRERQTAAFDLTLGLFEWEGEIYGTAEYAAELFDASTIERLVGDVEALLTAALDAPSARLSALLAAGDDETARIVREWSGAPAEYPRVPVHRLFEEVAARTPGAVALRLDSGETVTYADLNARASRIARHLRSLGVGVESRVGLSMERSAELVAALLGILKAGGAYVPLDPAYPAARLGFMRRDAGVEIVVAADPSTVSAWSGEARIVSLTDEGDAIAALPANDLPVEVDPEGLAYVIYTSGSTGQPKGAAVPHRAVVRLVRGQEYASFGADEVFLQLAPVAFDASTFELWGALLNGGSIAIYPDAVPDPRSLGEFVRRHGVTTAWLTAGLFHQVVDAGAEGFGGLRQLLAGGDVLSAAHVARAMELLPGVRLIDGYGPTEATTFTCCHTIRREDAEAGSIPIGRPLANARVYVLDAGMRPVPAGTPGELYAGGDGVARGYLGRPGMTAERFVPDPFADGGRLYRTGDRARWTESAEAGSTSDGAESERTPALPHSRTAVLDFLGRADAQVKLRGFRIEPGEIEAVLRALPGVRDAVVDVRGEGERKRLAAYVVPADGAPLSAAELKAGAADRLPDYMVPAAFVVLDALPITPNGKVDRRALPDPDFAAAEYVAPRTATEEIVAGMWAELLGTERIGATDDFFGLGGHSLLATRVVTRVREAFGAEVPMRALFDNPVLGDFAAVVDEARREGEGRPQLPPLVPQPRGRDVPLSFTQERLWVLQRLAPQSPAYNVPVTVRVSGPLDAAALERAVGEVVRRHEALRTAIATVDGAPVQRVLPPGVFRLPVHDVSRLAPEAREDEARRLVYDDRRTPFSLDGGPLFNAFVVRLAEDDHVLYARVHHTVFDGWSAGIFQKETWALYDAFLRGEPSPLPELAVQYADYAVWQRTWMADAAGAQVGYWKEALSGAPPLLELPTDRPRPAVQSYRAGLVEGGLAPALQEAVRALARREGATPFMVLLAALDVVLARWSGQDDVVVGTQVAGRTHAGTEPLLGVFLNTLAVRTSLAGAPSFRAVLARVREATLDAYAHQDVPFERVLEVLDVPRSLAHSPVFQVQLNFLNLDEIPTELPGGLSAAGFGTENATAKFDLTIYAQEGEHGLGIGVVYAADLFEAARIRALLAQVESVLAQASADPDVAVGALSLATADEASVLPDPARPIAAEAWRGAVHRLVAERAAETPDAIAIQDAKERWTYAELDAAANRIARRLVEDGVKPGDTVAVWAHRSAPLVRALLAAWKAGAAFVSLDPAYPPARLAEYVRIAKPSALLRIAAAGEVPAEVAEALAETAKSTVDLGPKGKGGAEEPAAEAPSVDVGPDGLAYVAFTSGTTGTPKAVAGTHRPLTHFFGWYAREMGAGANDRFTLLAGLAHDPLLRDVLAPLTVGGTIVIPDPEGLGTPGWLAEWMGRERITIAHLTPATIQLIAAGAGNATLPALRLACFGGDLLRAADVRTLRSIAPNARAVNFYGATETPQAMGAYPVPDDLSAERETLPVGRGIDGVDLLVLNAAGGLAGIGEVGEISIRTPYLSRGYLNDAGLTEARFVANPWTGDAADRMYRTGDLGRYRADGAVEIAGRADAQLKVRGFRVEAGEVEAALRRHPSVREAVAMAVGEGENRRLVAYLVAEGEAPRAVVVRGHLRKLLPDYMVPSTFVWLDALPLTPNGKVDRRALPDPDAPAPVAPVAPRTATEEVIAGIWAEVLGVESVGVEDDFFTLGGHSLRATQVLARIAQMLEVEIPLRAMFETPTVAGLAAHVEAAGGGALADALAELDGLSDEEVAALLAEAEGD